LVDLVESCCQSTAHQNYEEVNERPRKCHSGVHALKNDGDPRCVTDGVKNHGKGHVDGVVFKSFGEGSPALDRYDELVCLNREVLSCNKSCLMTKKFVKIRNEIIRCNSFS
jgi:hypothetical protein